VIRVERLFLSSDHNFFGHHGRPSDAHPILEVDQVECVAGRGLLGDRFFNHKPDYKGQITFFAAEVFEQMCAALGLTEADPSALRRNVLVRGADLPACVGQEFSIQGIRFSGTEECRPCHWMNQALHHEAAEDWLKGRGGLRARILTNGTLRREL
jgi:MOSC domain-containing protein YiiM